MPKGGARINSGPPPDPNALRRDRAQDRDGWTLLPAAGRAARAPTFPLRSNAAQLRADAADDWREVVEDIDARELQVWADIWSTPQAVAWERLGWLHDVALYVRFMVVAERGDLKSAGEVRQWSDRLGLNPAAMLRNRWKIAPDQLGARREAASRPTGVPTARDRMKARG